MTAIVARILPPYHSGEDRRADDPRSLARAHVCIAALCIGFSLKKGELLETENARKYRSYPPFSSAELRSLLDTYRETTGRGVYRSMVGILAQILRRHGPDAEDLVRELFEAHGPNNLLAVMLRWPPAREPEDPLDRLVGDYMATENHPLGDSVGGGPHPFCDLSFCQELPKPDTALVGGRTLCITCRDWNAPTARQDGPRRQ
jgi:hypothetical protein